VNTQCLESLIILNSEINILLFPQTSELPLRCVPRVSLAGASCSSESVTVFIPFHPESNGSRPASSASVTAPTLSRGQFQLGACAMAATREPLTEPEAVKGSFPSGQLRKK